MLNLGGMKVGEARTASVLVMERDINEMMTTIRGQNEKIAKKDCGSTTVTSMLVTDVRDE